MVKRGGGTGQDKAPMTQLEISSLGRCTLEAHYYFSHAVLGCFPLPPFLKTDHTSMRLSLILAIAH